MSAASVNLLEIRGLSTWFPIRRGVLAAVHGHVQALTEVDLALKPGETVGLVGESGCGKTTLGRTLMGLDEPTRGDALFKGEAVIAAGRPARRGGRRDMQMIFQDPMASLNPRMTVLDIVAEGMQRHGLLEGSPEEAVGRILRDVGLDETAFHRYPFEFSGGQRQRICIARALALKPSLLICDEAVSALDVSVQAQVINLLVELRQKYGLAYLFISHDLSVVRFLSDRVAVMYLGRIVEEGPTEDIMNSPRHPYTQALLSAIPRVRQERKERMILSGEIPSPSNPPPGCPFHTRCPAAMIVCRGEMPPVTADGARSVRCYLHTGALPSAGPVG
jgi:oligopeptide/dipeptide ABC transporter ATP-binding protein